MTPRAALLRVAEVALQGLVCVFLILPGMMLAICILFPPLGLMVAGGLIYELLR